VTGFRNRPSDYARCAHRALPAENGAEGQADCIRGCCRGRTPRWIERLMQQALTPGPARAIVAAGGGKTMARAVIAQGTGLTLSDSVSPIVYFFEFTFLREPRFGV